MEVYHVQHGKRVSFAPAPSPEHNPHQQERMVAGLQGWALSQARQTWAAHDRMEVVGYCRFHATTFPAACSEGGVGLK